MRDGGARIREEGSGSVLLLGVVAVGATVALTVASVGAVTAARHRAVSAADLAALAAADVLLGRADGDPCERAADVGRAVSARLTRCRTGVEGGGPVAEVETAVDLPGVLARLGSARAVARAGAQPTRSGS